mmetsp:Transcript_17571/g.39817  ORF Transcript_17571/g.39817 Transcript_17571/m.39817 type:complete len:290 (-) Transcript_17571:92-961(-)
MGPMAPEEASAKGEGPTAERFALEELQPKDHPKVMEIATQVFCHQNDVLNFLGVSQEAWHEVEMYDSQGWERDGLSLVARDLEAGGKIVAFLLATRLDLRKPPPDFTKALEISPSLVRLFEIDGANRFPAMFHREYRHASWLVGRSCRVAAGGTMAGYEGRGLGLRLREHLVQLARAKGYDAIQVETISVATQHIWNERLGFDILARVPFRDFRAPDASLPFKDMPGELHEMTLQQKVLRRRPLRDATFWLPGLGFAMNLRSSWPRLANLILRFHQALFTLLGALWCIG